MCKEPCRIIHICAEHLGDDIFVYFEQDDEFFACKFGLEEKTGVPYLLLAGRAGVLKVINCVTGMLHWVSTPTLSL